jgi:hypothetical protein
MQTGDIILFNSVTPCACMVSLGTCSKWNHVGIILNDYENFKGIHVLECGLELIPDVYGNKLPLGVQIQKLENIREFYPRMYYRHLKINRNDEFMKNIKYLISTIENASYDFTISSWKELTESVILGKNEEIKEIENNTQFVCSAMVAYIFNKLGLIKFANWKTITPEFFAKVKIDFLSDLNRI